jgi:hypothetical protein
MQDDDDSPEFRGHKTKLGFDSVLCLRSAEEEALVRRVEIGLCDHGEGRSEPFGTIYSWVAELGTGQVHVAHGKPCENEYKAVEIGVS